MLLSGRGFGKSRTGGEWIISRVQQGYKHIALVGQTVGDVRNDMIQTNPGAILNISPPWMMPEYEPSLRRLTWPSSSSISRPNSPTKNLAKAVATTFSGDTPDQLRGPEHDTAWVDELAKFKYPQETWDNLEFGLRLGDNPQAVVTTTPRPIPIIKNLKADPNTVTVVGSTYDNAENLAPRTVQRLNRRYEGTRLGRQELHGEILDDNPDALWERDWIENRRVMEHPNLIRVVVGVDPQASNNKNSAETGIVGAGRAHHGDGPQHGYTLGDFSVKGTPEVWGRAAITAFNVLQADCIVAEANNGGDMVKHVIHTINPNIPVKLVWASRGKEVRAEPISSLSEQGRIHHVGSFAELEDQLCEWVPGDKSPDRLDAYVWAYTELFGLDLHDVHEEIVVHDTMEGMDNMDLEIW